ncbi:hypothetical protein CC86DRAFT_397284 [Ophiobolus disseminans]|uniref:LPXTG-domain-containing protein n=1 Tax=Ophiobolus disseminans TaxID=1469910 RepID=A0A6A6ZL67_9PLEO|nr:hypothetical protein CC86DRAFT_397284 [Ophiobolus disseminans]
MALTILLYLSSFSSALEVSPNSPCTPKCIDDPSKGNASDPAASLTFSRDLFCYDWEIIGDNRTHNGTKFKECQNCMKSSGYAWSMAIERDTTWFLYNNRAVLDWCLFGRVAEEENKNIAESSIYKSCNPNCNKLYSAADYAIKTNPDSFSYCDYSGNFTADAEPCLTCLYEMPGSTILGNVLATVVDLCKQKPGKVYNFPKDHEIYAATKINLSGTTPASSANSTPSSTASSSKSDNKSTSKLAAVVLGALISIVLVLTCVLVLLRRKKKSNKAVAEKPHVDGETAYPKSVHHHYNHVGSQQKPEDIYQRAEMDHTSRVELSAQGAQSELPGGAVSPRGDVRIA